MQTIILSNKLHGSSARKAAAGKKPAAFKYSIEVAGGGPVKDEVRQSIRDLEVHPAASRRSLLDMLDIIDRHRLEIRHVEHKESEEEGETWLFVLQRR